MEDNIAMQHQGSYWRNRFHITMPFGLINDPNGLSYFNGKFHIFYQWNPHGCEHKDKHWGLVTTTDFVHFSTPQIALKPDEWFDKDGCYSGCGLVVNNQLQLYYTGNVKNQNGERESYQCMAVYNQDGNIEKKGVLIDGQPQGYTAHFRDPYLFYQDNCAYMVLGSQTEKLTGTALLYQSQDLVKWNLLGELKMDLGDFGYMWECPNLISVDEDQTAFIFSPQGLSPEPYQYQNKFQAGYIIGNLNLKELALEAHTNFKELDMGFDFYAPQVFEHQGESLMIGWAGMPDGEGDCPTSLHGWMYSLTMPRVLTYQDGQFYQQPLDVLKNLRQKLELEVSQKTVSNYQFELAERSKEIQLWIGLNGLNCFRINFRFGKELLFIECDPEKGVCTIDRSQMLLGGRGIRRFKLNCQESLKLAFYIDQSIMEIYFQDGIEVTTITYFPVDQGMEIELLAQEQFEIRELQMWDLRSICYNDLKI